MFVLYIHWFVQLGGPRIEMRSGRRDSRESHASVVEEFIPNHNDSMALVLSRFESVGIDVEGTVALLGKCLIYSSPSSRVFEHVLSMCGLI